MRTGDSLQTIAQAAYGDSQLWYLIADANGLAGNSDLRVGQTVNIPTKVGSIHNTAGTYKPYDPSQVIGSTTPTLPVPQSGGGDDCGGLGLIIMIIVAVVVVIATEGAASEWAFEMTMQAAAAEGATAASVTITATAASVAAGAAVGAAASIASQLVGMALGVVDEFSWKAVALSAISGGITQGLPAGDLLGTTAGTIGNTIVRAAVANAMTQGIAVAVGLQDRFDWRGVAASAIGAGVGASVGKGLGTSSSTGEQIFKASLTGLAAGTATALARGGRVSVQQIASDAFGNALGESIAQQSLTGGGSGGLTYYDGDIGRSELRIGQPARLDSPDLQQFIAAFGDGSSSVDRSNDVLLAAGPGFKLAPGGRSGDSLNVTIGGGKDDLDLLEIQVKTMQKELDSILRAKAGQAAAATYARDSAQSTSNLYATGAGDVRGPFYSTPSSTDTAGGSEANQAFRRSEIEQMNREAAQSPQPVGPPMPSFQEENDQRVITGSYDRFSEIGGALSSRNYGEAWRHINFEASPSARAAVNQRLSPRLAPGMQQLDVLLNGGPLATLGYLGARAAGASAAGQLNASTLGSISDGVFGAFGGVAAARSGNRMPFTGAQPGFAGVQIGAPTEATKVGSSARMQYMGATPDKYSRTGREVVERMRNEGLIVGEGPLLRGNPNGLQMVEPMGALIPIDAKVDMAHRIDAVSWWNSNGRSFGAKSHEVREFMLNSDNYLLQSSSANRSAGALLRQTYLPPAPVTFLPE